MCRYTHPFSLLNGRENHMHMIHVYYIIIIIMQDIYIESNIYSPRLPQNK